MTIIQWNQEVSGIIVYVDDVDDDDYDSERKSFRYKTKIIGKTPGRAPWTSVPPAGKDRFY